MNAQLGRPLTVIRDEPEIVPNLALVIRHLRPARVRRGPRADRIQLKTIDGFLVLAENPLEQRDRRRPVEIGLFDVLVVEGDSQVVDVNHVADDVELLGLADRVAAIIDLHKLDA